MSFIYKDINLVKNLITISLDVNEKFTKRGQALQQDKDNLLNLIKDLQDQINPAGKESSNSLISHQGSADFQPQLKSSDLEDISTLASWLIINKITLDGRRIAYDIREDPKDEKYTLFQLEPGSGGTAGQLENIDRKKPVQGYFIDPQLFSKFIVSLQAHNKDNPNTVMSVQLDRLISQSNKLLGTGIKEQYQAPEKTLSDNVILDNAPKDFIDDQISINGGNIPLTYGDIKDDLTFNNWLSHNSITWRADHQQVGANHPKFNKCAVLDILFARAKNKVSHATTSTMKENALIYARQIETVASASQCSLKDISQPTGTDKQKDNTSTSQSLKTDKETDKNTDLSNVIDRIIDTLPLSLQNIDFNRINAFFSQIAQLMSNNPTVMNYINTTHSLMTQVSNITENDDTVFQLGISPSAVVNMFKDKKTPGKQFFNFTHGLNQIIDNVRAVVGYFLSQYGNQINPSQRAFIYGQIGKRPDDSSIYSRNIQYLNNWSNTPHT